MQSNISSDKVKIRALTITSIALSVVLVAVIALSYLGFFFGGGNQRATNDILLGQTTTIGLTEGASATTFSFNGAALPGDEYMQNINMQLPYTLKESFVRASFYVVNSNGSKNDVHVSLMEDFIAHTDGYYYYNHLMKNGETVSLTRSITIPDNMMLNPNKVYNIVVIIETLNKDIDISAVWTTAPVDLIANTI